jgi:hypothetical protein
MFPKSWGKKKPAHSYVPQEFENDINKNVASPF